MTISPDQIRLLRERLKRERLAEARRVRHRAAFVAYFAVMLERGYYWIMQGPILKGVDDATSNTQG